MQDASALVLTEDLASYERWASGESPCDIADFYERGLRHLAAGHWRSAVQNFRSWSALQPQDFRSLYYTVVVLARHGADPDAYLGDIEAHDRAGGDRVAANLLRAIELTGRSQFVPAVQFLGAGLDSLERSAPAGKACLAALDFLLSELDRCADAGTASPLAISSTLSALRQLAYRAPFWLLCQQTLQRVTLNNAVLAAGVVRFLAGFEPDLRRGFAERHGHLKHSPSFSREVCHFAGSAGDGAPVECRGELNPHEQRQSQLWAIRSHVTSGRPAVSVRSDGRRDIAELIADDIAALKHPGRAGPADGHAICFFGQIRDAAAFEVLKLRLAARLDADVFVATWTRIGKHILIPDLNQDAGIVRTIIPPESLASYDRLGITNFASLRRIVPELYDELTRDGAPHDGSGTDPEGIVTSEFLHRGMVPGRIFSRTFDHRHFEDWIGRLTSMRYSAITPHFQNQIRMWFLIFQALLLRRETEAAHSRGYRRVLLIRTDLALEDDAIEALARRFETIPHQGIMFDEDHFAWTVGGIGERYLAANHRELDVLMIPWLYASYFDDDGHEEACFLANLVPHVMVRDLAFAAALDLHPVPYHEVPYQISRRNRAAEKRMARILKRRVRSRFQWPPTKLFDRKR